MIVLSRNTCPPRSWGRVPGVGSSQGGTVVGAFGVGKNGVVSASRGPPLAAKVPVGSSIASPVITHPVAHIPQHVARPSTVGPSPAVGAQTQPPPAAPAPSHISSTPVQGVTQPPGTVPAPTNVSVPSTAPPPAQAPTASATHPAPAAVASPSPPTTNAAPASVASPSPPATNAAPAAVASPSPPASSAPSHSATQTHPSPAQNNKIFSSNSGPASARPAAPVQSSPPVNSQNGGNPPGRAPEFDKSTKGLPSGASYNAFGFGITVHNPSTQSYGNDNGNGSGNGIRDKVDKELGIGQFMN